MVHGGDLHTGSVLDLLVLFDWICDGRIVNCNTLVLTSAVLIRILFGVLVCVFSVELIIVQLVLLNVDKDQ